MRPQAWTALAVALALLVPGSALAAPAPAGSWGEGELGRMMGVALTPDGKVYVVDTEHSRVARYSATGVLEDDFGTAGAGDGQFANPGGVAIGTDGDVYVADSDNHRVQQFTAAGSFIRVIGGLGDAQDQMHTPAGLAVDAAGDLFVADTNHHRIQRFSSEGVFEATWGVGVDGGAGFETCTSGCRPGVISPAAGGLHYPKDIAVDENGRLAVAEPYNHRVSQFTASGGFVRAWGVGVAGGAGFETCTTACQEGDPGTGAGAIRASAWGIAADRGGSIFLADSENGRIQQFTTSGGFVRAWGEGVRTGAPGFETCTLVTGCRAGFWGSGSGSLNNPTDVAARCKRVLVADWGNERIQLFDDPAACPVATKPPAKKPATKPKPVVKPTPTPAAVLRLGRPRARKDGTALLTATVPGAGRLTVTDSRKGRIRRVTRTASKAGSVKVRLRPTRAGRRLLKRRGTFRARVRVSYRPAGGDEPTVKTVLVRLRRR